MDFCFSYTSSGCGSKETAKTIALSLRDQTAGSFCEEHVRRLCSSYPGSYREIQTGKYETSGYFFIDLPSMTFVQLVPSCDISYVKVYAVGDTTFMV